MGTQKNRLIPPQWDGSFEHPKHMLKIMGKKIFKNLRWKYLFILPCDVEQIVSGTTSELKKIHHF